MLRRAGIVAAVSICIAATACTGSDNHPTDASTEYSLTQERALTATQRSLLRDAEQILVQRCMRRQGFRVWKVPERPVAESKDFPYVVDDVAWARKHGYGSELERRARELRSSAPNQRYLRELPSQRRNAALAALHGQRRTDLSVELPSGAKVGRSSEGCTAEAETALYGDLAAWFRAEAITQTLSGMRYTQVTTDPDFKKSEKAWSTCMHRQGFRYTRPSQSRNHFLSVPGSDPKEEVATAVTEAKCANTSRLSATSERLTRKYGEKLRRKYSSVIRDRNRLQKAALPKAREIIAEG